MRPGSFISLIVLLTAGCIGSTPPAPTGNGQNLPSADRCGTDALPDPDRTDGLSLSEYPEPPERVNRSTVTGYIVGFERAYFRNVIIAEAAADRDMNLTRATVSAVPERVDRRDDGWEVVLATSAGTQFADGVHGDRWPTVGYFVNEAVLIRANVDGVNASVRDGRSTTLLRCSD